MYCGAECRTIACLLGAPGAVGRQGPTWGDMHPGTLPPGLRHMGSGLAEARCLSRRDPHTLIVHLCAIKDKDRCTCCLKLYISL